MPNTIEALLDEDILKDDQKTLDVELHEQESRESNCIVNNTKINNDHIEDDSQNPKVTIREHDQDIESVKEDVEAADKSAMDELENYVKESNTMRQIIRKRDPESKFGINSKEVDQGSSNNYNDIHTGHDKYFVTVGREISEKGYQDTHDLIL